MLKQLMKRQRLMTITYSFFLFFMLRDGFQQHYMDIIPVLINLLFILPLFGILLFIFRNNAPAILIHSLFIYTVYYVDRVVYSARLTHLRYSDLFAISDGLRVANRYQPVFSTKDGVLLAIIIVFSIAAFYATYKIENNKKENAIIGGGILAISTLLIIFGTVFHWIPDPLKSIDDNFDTNSVAERNGIYYNLYGEYLHSRLKKPEGYSEDKAKEILSSYQKDSVISGQINVIVIMNEAFADYSLIGKTFFEDPLENIHNPENGYFEGKLGVSVFAGYTCNTEYEFLTGNSMAFFPDNYIPFSQLITRNMNSIALEMKELGMEAVGIHPYYSQEWNRRNVYHFLGFDQFIAGEDFSTGLVNDNIANITDTHLMQLDFGLGLEYIRGFISDAECYRKVLSVMDESANADFIFAVTVQNHGGYDYKGEDFRIDEFIQGVGSINQYLTLSSISDAAFKDFTDELSRRNEKTIVMMFGDHQPGLNLRSLVDGYGDSLRNRYYVPYVVWSNFDLVGDFPEITSANYLSALLKKNVGLPLTCWDQFRLEMMKEYPVVTGNFVLDSKLSPGSTDSSTLLEEYAVVQYYMIKK